MERNDEWEKMDTLTAIDAIAGGSHFNLMLIKQDPETALFVLQKRHRRIAELERRITERQHRITELEAALERLILATKGYSVDPDEVNRAVEALQGEGEK